MSHSKWKDIRRKFSPEAEERIRRMKEEMALEKVVYKIRDKESGGFASAYSRAYHDEEEWESRERALHANVHGIFKDEARYEIVKYRVTYEEVSDDL